MYGISAADFSMQHVEVSLVIIRFLGMHNAESRDTKLVSFLIDDVLAVDAGNLTSGLSFAEQENIKAILLSHGHYDHIKDVPAFAFNNSQRTTKVFASQRTLEILSSHLVDGLIYPEFTNRNSYLGRPALELSPLEPFKPKNIEGYRVLAIPVHHPIDAIGFGITSREGKEILYTGDTGPGLSPLWNHLNPQVLITDLTFPNRFTNVVEETGHLCPQMLETELIEFRRVRGYLPKVILTHLSPKFEEEIRKEVMEVAKELRLSIEFANEGERVIV